MRDTPAARIIREIFNEGYKNIVAYDPVANVEFKKYYPDLPIRTLDSVEEVYGAADIIAIVTAWKEFKKVPNLGSKKIIDCRYML